MKVRFLHSGDTHLGCFPNRIETRFDDFFNVFKNMITYGINNKIELLLISGDLFHLKSINSRTLLNTIECLEMAKAAKMEVIVIEGNHDRAFLVDGDSWLHFLNEQGYIKLLGEPIVDGQLVLNLYEEKSGSVIENDKYRVIGVSYLGGMTEKYIKSLNKLIKKTDQFTILMLHAAIDRLQGQEMGDVKSEVILGLKDVVDYIALGHIHVKYEIEDLCYNPGSLENIRLRDGRRSEEKGFYDIIVNDDNTKEVNYIKSEPRKVHYQALDITEAIKPQDVKKMVQNLKLDMEPNEMMELTVFGKPNFNPYLIELNEIEVYLKEKYHLLYIEVKTAFSIFDQEDGENEVVDTQAIVRNLIEKKLEYNYPDTKDIKAVAKTMIRVSEMINDNLDEDTIIDTLYKPEVKL
mgnify:FL=1